MNLSRLILGSAQFGMKYGIANQHGQADEQEVEKILNLAHSNHIHTIDTASVYGVSESTLGKFASPDFNIITKLPALSADIEDVGGYVTSQYQSSLENLHREACYGLLAHKAADLLGPQGSWIYQALAELKIANKVKKIGVSVYSVEQVHSLLERFQLDIIQFPLNILDQRFIQHSFLTELKTKGIELHARSIFLQGLLLMKQDNLPMHFAKILPLLQDLQEECENKGLTLRQALIEFVLSIPEIDHYIVGIDNASQLIEIMHDVSSSKPTSQLQFQRYNCTDMDIINPMNWKLQ